MSLKIRRAKPEDAPLLAALGSTSYRYHFEQYWVSDEELQAFIEQEYAQDTLAESLADPTVSWFIAEAEKPVGFTKISWNRPVPEHSFAGALLNKLYLAPGETGKNYGRLLFEEVLQLAQKREQSYLWLEVLEGNLGARRFYQAQGMRHLTSETFSSATQTSTIHILGRSL
ncbi:MULTISPECIES: GNAT family N-acetyltransferase [Cedecea]|jgi:ribosomal protein S18 acetylase RimI-like enzyme|uniref:Alanine acetyltransferase n=1 Tax=Cedecea neteri TaxID=158822 RepID=A0A089PWX1_9ENTR|nr:MULTISPECIES: GNAT family N-acetyltransferase [Cedecea]AIR04543.1 alanine acetyltransferase [Cedecea neteri]NWC63308.1 GNAT family N-acetyltransferase [Cedecea sp. P7760]